MITKESLAIRASKMLVGKHMVEHDEYNKRKIQKVKDVLTNGEDE